MRQLVELVTLLGQRQAVWTRFVIAIFDLLHHRRNAYFEELVKIAGRDGQELQALEKRIALIFGLFEHTTVKREPRGVPIEEVLGIVQ